MKKIKTAIIGFGLSGSKFHAPFILSSKEFELSAIVAKEVEDIKAKMPGYPVYDEIDTLLKEHSDIELIIVSTPTSIHFKTAKKAMLAGKNVIVEKPFVVNEEEGRELIELAKKQNVILTVYQSRRWDGDFLTVKELIESGKLGSVHSVEMNWDRYRPEIRNRWKESNIPGGGFLYDVSPHMIDQALQLFGYPKTVYGDMGIQREGGEAIDYYHLILGYDKVRVMIRGGSLVVGQTPRFIVHGTEGSYIVYGLDPQENRLVSGICPSDDNFKKPDETRISILTNADGSTVNIPIQWGGYVNFFNKLAGAIRYGEEIPVDAEDGLAVIRVIEAAIRSSEEGKVMKFD